MADIKNRTDDASNNNVTNKTRLFPKRTEVDLSFEDLTYTVSYYSKFKRGETMLLLFHQFTDNSFEIMREYLCTAFSWYCWAAQTLCSFAINISDNDLLHVVIIIFFFMVLYFVQLDNRITIVSLGR